MTDKVTINCKSLMGRIEQMFAEFPATSVKQSIRNSVPSFEAFYNGMRFKTVADNVSVSGSIPKYDHGNNVRICSYDEIKTCFGEISEMIGVSTSEMKITSLEVGANLFVKNTPESYFPLLGECPRMGYPQKWNSTLYYNEIKRRQKKFYDKMKDAKAKGMKFDHSFYEKNLLRFEVSYKTALVQQLGFFPSVENMLEKNNYNNLINKWKEEFEMIRFNKIPYLSSSISTAKDFKDYCASKYLADNGQEYSYSMVENLSKSESFSTSKEKYRVYNILREVFSNDSIHIEDERVIELREQVNLLWEMGKV
jgi:hypothetical protein